MKIIQMEGTYYLLKELFNEEMELFVNKQEIENLKGAQKYGGEQDNDLGKQDIDIRELDNLNSRDQSFDKINNLDKFPSDLFLATDNALIKDPSLLYDLKDKNTSYWDSSVLPLSYYLTKISLRLYKYKASKAESLDIFTIKPKRLSTLLTQLDIILLQNIKPVELLTSNISYLTNKNTGLVNFISSLLHKEKSHAYFNRVLKYLLADKNYNSAGCIKKAFLRHKVSKKTLVRLEYTIYNDKGIPHFEIFLKDLEDSTNNTDSSSLRFCKLVELLVSIQNKTVKINKKREHFLLYKIWTHIEEEEKDKEEGKDDYLYLYI